MKKSIAILAALAALAAPLTAQAHRAWLAPTATVLSGKTPGSASTPGCPTGCSFPTTPQ